MSYFDFLNLIKENTGNKLDDYKELCRFCLQVKSHKINVSSDDHNLKQQRDAILNNYSTITKQFLPIEDTYPTFVCSSCEENLTNCAFYAQQIEKNAENWEMFLKNGNDVKGYDDFNSTVVRGIEEIKIECCDVEFEDEPVTNSFDALELELPALKVEISSDIVSESQIKPKKHKTDNSEPTYINHANLSTEYERTCKLCDVPTFSSLARFYRHQREYHPGEKSFICGICGSKFNNKTRLAAHVKDRHARCGKKHQCQFCAKLFYSDREVKGHELLHVNARSYVCNFCGKGFNQKTTLNVHLRSKAHNMDYKTIPYVKRPFCNRKKTFRCQLCVPSTLFSSPMELSAHRNEMHRKYECDICKNSFMAQESLDSHKLLHSDKPRPFVCQVCNATFNQSSHLSSHFRRKHKGEKSFQCSNCCKSFYESCELNAHVRLVHTKQKRVKCDHCDCDFATDKYLQKHVLQKHTTEASPYDCKVCGKRMENGVRLDHHRIKHHKIYP